MHSILATAACALLLSPLLASGEEATFEVALSGPEASGDPDGQGQATVVLNSETNAVDVRLRYSNIGTPTALYIRMGATGMEGNIALPVVIESDEEGMLVGRRESSKPKVVETILASPAEYHLVVVNEEYPVGALRGQLQE
jgi:hypothetical protein